MDIRQLRSFLAVIDHGSFSAAAQALFTVQSNVSAHVARLEAELNVGLIDRQTRSLTPAGRAVEQRARTIVDELGAISDDLASLEGRIVGEVACGTTPSVGLWVLPPTLAAATLEFPDIAITVVEGQSGDLAPRLLNGDIDMAITTGANKPDLAATPLFDEDILAVMAPTHPLAHQETITLHDLASANLLVPLADNPLHLHIAKAFEHARIPFHIGLEVGSSALITAMSSEGVGVALVPATAHTSHRAHRPTIGRSVELLPPRSVALTTRRGARPSQAEAAIAELLIRMAKIAAQTMPGCHLLEADRENPSVDVLSMP